MNSQIDLQANRSGEAGFHLDDDLKDVQVLALGGGPGKELGRIHFMGVFPPQAVRPMVYCSVKEPRPSDLARTMKPVTLQLTAETERKLRDRAQQLGQSLEIYLQLLAEKAVENGPIAAHLDAFPGTPPGTVSEELPKFISRPKLTRDELEHLLDEFSAGPPGPVLPADFSRADIYDDHD
jgi:hypothetical protein